MLLLSDMDAQQPIGIFDSGIGGLTAAHEISNLLPQEKIIYYGDTANMPYGKRTAQEIIVLSKKITEFLLSKNAKLIIIACNSASANAASYLRKNYHHKVEIRGVIRPMIEEVVQRKYKNIGIIGTKATINSKVYDQIFAELNYSLKINSMATPKLAAMIEQKVQKAEIQKALEEYLGQESFKDIEALLLACTHYPIVKQEFVKFFNSKVDILDNAFFIAQNTREYLKRNQLLAQSKSGKDEFYVSKLTDSFKENATAFFKREISIKKVNL